jgi:hypothetical protein
MTRLGVKEGILAMPDLFESEIGTIQVSCKECGAPLEIASTAMGVFGSQESILCMDCLLRQGVESSPEATVPLQERVRMIDETVDDFAARLRSVLLRGVKSDLSWGSEYAIEDWSHPMDIVAAAYAPGIWYAVRPRTRRPAFHDDH